mmetsp:Transcript_26850/g.30683  ORF Transcript_26850/g.30683 Transcript_26850/m.30683 type:complete len:282 (+) Transcript_26850:68-913(+)
MVKITKTQKGNGVCKIILFVITFSSLLAIIIYLTILPQQSRNEDAEGTVLLLDGGLSSSSSKTQLKNRRIVTCSTSKGIFEIELFPETSPNGYHQFLKMLENVFFDQGIAFFRVNKVAIQFGADQQARFRPNGIDPYKSVREPWTMDPNPYNNDKNSNNQQEKIRSSQDNNNDNTAQQQQHRRNQHAWTRGTLAMIGGTQMLITRVSGGHTMGTAPHDSPLGKIIGDGMERVFDKLYDGYGNVLDDKQKKGLDQIQIFERGMDYIQDEFPKTDYILHCQMK